MSLGSAPAPSSPGFRRPWLTALGLTLAGLGLPVALVAWFGLTQQADVHGMGEWIGTLIAVVAFSVPLILGLWLANRGRPGLAREVVAKVRSGISALGQPAGRWAALRTSLGLALATVLVALPAMYLWRGGSLLVAFLAFSAFSLADPILNTQRRSWWRGALLSAGTWLALFGILSSTADSIHRMGEDSMIFLLPFMGYPVVLAASGVVRIVLNRGPRITP